MRTVAYPGIAWRWLGVLLLLFFSLLAQSQSTDELKQQRAELLEAIQENTSRLNQTRRNKAQAVEQLAILQDQLSKREALIATLQQEIALTESSMERTSDVVVALRDDMERMEVEYAQLIRAAYRAKLQNSWLTFLLSSRSFNEAFRRWQYLRRYRRFRSRQARLIAETQQTLERKLNQLEVDRAEKTALYATADKQRLSMSRERNAQDQLLTRLSKNEASLATEIRQQEAAREELSQAIEKAIATEMERIRRAERATRTTGSSTPSPIDKTVITAASANFAQQRGQLPWPINGEITKPYGRQPHPTVKGIEISNNGIDISVSGRREVKVVAAGTVVSISFVPGFRNLVMVRHGDYYTVYSNLETVSVRKDAELSAGASVGSISEGTGDLHFEIWRGKERLNPTRWIR